VLEIKPGGKEFVLGASVDDEMLGTLLLPVRVVDRVGMTVCLRGLGLRDCVCVALGALVRRSGEEGREEERGGCLKGVKEGERVGERDEACRTLAGALDGALDGALAGALDGALDGAGLGEREREAGVGARRDGGRDG